MEYKTDKDLWVEAEANARLMAAAPVLLSALKRLTEDADAMSWSRNSSMADESIEIARAAIAKAEGE